MDAAKQVARSYDISTNVSQLHQKRAKLAQEHMGKRLFKAYADCVTTRLASCAVAALVAQARRETGSKAVR